VAALARNGGVLAVINDAITIVLILVIGFSAGIITWCVWDWYINRGE
jgi:hypothetical protein